MANQNKAANLLGSVSFVMLLVCFILGAGLVQNDDRINEMEMKIAELENRLQGTQSVFALSSNETTEETTLTEQTTETTQIQTEQAKHTEYKVQKGDTLIGISKNKYGTASKVNEIRELNEIAGNKIVVGETLLLP